MHTFIVVLITIFDIRLCYNIHRYTFTPQRSRNQHRETDKYSRHTNRQTDRLTDRYSRQTDTQRDMSDRQIFKQILRQICRQICPKDINCMSDRKTDRYASKTHTDRYDRQADRWSDNNPRPASSPTTRQEWLNSPSFIVWSARCA